MKLVLFLSIALAFANRIPAAEVPQSVAELWADFDPRRDPLATEIVREWKADGMVLRAVRFCVGTFKGKPARLKDAKGNALAHWQQLDALGLCARYAEPGAKPTPGPASWNGALPQFHRLEWSADDRTLLPPR